MRIIEQIGVPAMYEQLAEECAELAQASLKLARKLRGENPTPKSLEECHDALTEEAADVELILDLLMQACEIYAVSVGEIKHQKHMRWIERLKGWCKDATY